MLRGGEPFGDGVAECALTPSSVLDFAGDGSVWSFDPLPDREGSETVRVALVSVSKELVVEFWILTDQKLPKCNQMVRTWSPPSDVAHRP